MSEKLLIVEDEFIVANDLTIILENAGYTICGIADTVESARSAIDELQPTWVLLDIYLQDGTMGTDLAPYLQEKGIGYIYISANTNHSVLEVAKATQPYGFLVKPFREKDLLIMLDIARGKHEGALQFTAQRELLLQQHLKNLADEQLPYEGKLQKLPTVFQSLIPFDYLAFHFSAKNHEDERRGAFYRVGFDEYQVFGTLDDGRLKEVFTNNSDQLPDKKTTFAQIVPKGRDGEYDQIFKAKFLQQFSTCLLFQFKSDEGELKLSFFNKKADAFDQSHTSLLKKCDKTIFRLFDTFSAFVDNTDLKQLRKAGRISQQPKPVEKFDGIYGNSAGLLNVLDNIELVANTPASVLILGESGTGKEKVAHNIHLLSSRKDAPFITVNCAAMPADLVESELFGHERGAFTGAVEKRLGKFEMANGGTIFLDEIGELPMESQVKLLRVLQEKQFEHIGGSKTVKVDVRIVAATNKNLEKEVADGRFRLDLFYRLNVYPITLPPLRERKEDIAILAKHFLVKSAASMHRNDIPELGLQALKQLTDYHWPGNIRELEHLMERTLIKSKQLTIERVELPVSHMPKSVLAESQNGLQKTLEEIEAEHILYILKSCNGKVTGAGGAAEILGINASTLTSRMKKLGIKKELYHDR